MSNAISNSVGLEAPGSAEARKRKLRAMMSTAGMLPVLLLLIIGFHFMSDGRFFTGQNISIVLQQASVNTVLAAG